MKNNLSLIIFNRSLKDLNLREYQSLKLLNSFLDWLGVSNLDNLDEYRKKRELEELICYIVSEKELITQKIENIYIIYRDYFIYFERHYNSNYLFSEKVYNEILNLIEKIL